MQIYHFYQLLPTLSKAELRNFRSFLKLQGAPGERLLPLLDYLKRFLPRLDDEKKLDPSAVFAHFYPEARETNRKLILNQLSALNNFLLDYLVAEKLKQIPALVEYLRVDILQERNQTDTYIRRGRKLAKQLEQKPASGSWDLFLLAAVYEHQLVHNTADKYPAKAEILKKLRKVLNEGYLAAYYKYAAAWVKFSQYTRDEEPMPEPEFSFDHGPLSHAYRLAYQLEKSGREEDYKSLFQRLTSPAAASIPWEDQYELLTSLINFAADQIKSGEKQYLREAFELYRYGLDSTILLRANGLTTDKFSNIVSLGCTHGEFEWTLAFIKNYQQHIPYAERGPLSVLSEANVLMEQKKYEACLAKLKSRQFSNPLYSLRQRLLELRAMYECTPRDEEEILQLCRNFRRFLQSNRSVKGENRKSAINFIGMLRDLVRRRKTRDQLQQKLLGFDRVFHLNWLESKLASYAPR